eukprot:scaffold7332_cov146-Amphora_coffeaeformis.AAC.3
MEKLSRLSVIPQRGSRVVRRAMSALDKSADGNQKFRKQGMVANIRCKLSSVNGGTRFKTVGLDFPFFSSFAVPLAGAERTLEGSHPVGQIQCTRDYR